MLAFLISLFITFPTSDSFHSELDTMKAVASDTTTRRYLYIDNIFIIGNKQTKESIILREMSITQGEYYYEKDLKELMQVDRRKILNTRLFNTVEISILELSENTVDIVVRVTERWYIFPVPIFDLVDRNFNDWWQNQNHDFSRVNYGLKLFRNNMRGRNETLKLQIQLGYTRQFDIAYKLPYIDRSQRHGLTVSYLYAENKNIPYQTVEHKRVFLDSEELLKVQRIYQLGYQFRKSFYTTHAFNVSFHDNDINDTIANINPEYYLSGRTSQRFLRLIYDVDIDKRDNNSYPLRGSRASFFIRKYGVGFFDDINQFDVGINYSRYLDLKKDYYLSNYSSIYMSGPDRQPYANIRGLGYRKDFIRGYELYVIEGQSFYLNRTTFKKKIIDVKTKLGIIPVEEFRSIPISVYLKTYFDIGYTHNLDAYPGNALLSDRFLFGTGMGVDVVTYYDTVIRFEFSVNREHETGLFIHLKKEF